MPLDAVKHSIHIRRKKNERVFNNIARLWEIARQAQTHQDILDALHPWNAPIVLKFENVLPLLLAAAGLFFILLIFIHPGNIWIQISLNSKVLLKNTTLPSSNSHNIFLFPCNRFYLLPI